MEMQTLLNGVSAVRKFGARLIALCCLLVVANSASAIPFPKPDLDHLDDLDDSGYFNAGVLGSLSLELFDLGDSVASFGVFEQGSPGTLIPIFEAGDLTNQFAIIDFAAGYVFDVEDNAIQSTFAPLGTLGFYLDFGGFVLYSDPTLNIGGADLMGAFPTVNGDYLSLLFFDGTADNPRRSLLSWNVISDVTAVPVPASPLLILAGLSLLAATRRQR